MTKRRIDDRKDFKNRLRRLKDLFLVRGHQFVYLFWSRDVIWLFALVCIIYVSLVALLACCLCKEHKPEMWNAAFSIMFDASVAKSSFGGCGKLIYLFVWLIGGGVLVSALIKRHDEIADCDYRLPKRCLGWINHIVVFGWNESVVEFVDFCQRKLKLDGNCNAVVILTTTAPERIRTALGDFGGALLIYRCEYDDERVRKKYLRLPSAKAIYVAGEDGSSLHDARAFLLADKIKDDICETMPCFCDIHDFGLAREMMKKVGPISYRNFHSAWGSYIVRKMSLDKPVYIASFGAMGKAVALAVKEKKPACEVFVSAEDDKFEQEWKRFEKECPDAAQTIRKIDFDLFEEAVRDNAEKTVVIALHRSEKGLLRLLELTRSVRHKNNTYFLDQEIEGAVGQKECECVSTRITNQTITVFGMKRGAPWSIHDVAECYRNQDALQLQKYAAQQGDSLVAACKESKENVRWVLGGSLAYNAALKGSYDIDLRLLVPGAWDAVVARQRIDRIRDLLVEEAKDDPTFKTRFIDEGGTNYIQHTKRIVRIPGVDADVELSWNIQAESSYRSIGEMAARLPSEVIDRFVVEKWNARAEGKDAYKLVKSEWRQMIEELIDQGGRDLSAEELSRLLTAESKEKRYPRFLLSWKEQAEEAKGQVR